MTLTLDLESEGRARVYMPNNKHVRFLNRYFDFELPIIAYIAHYQE